MEECATSGVLDSAHGNTVAKRAAKGKDNLEICGDLEANWTPVGIKIKISKGCKKSSRCTAAVRKYLCFL